MRLVASMAGVVAFIGLLPIAAHAQTNPLGLIAQYESNYNPTAQNPNSTASGEYQMINSTWAQASCAVGSCGTYATAGAAPLSLQTQAAAWLYDNKGFQPWTVGDPALANAINVDGGPQAFQQNLATDAGTYASLNGETLQQFLAAGGGTGDGNGGGDTGGGVAPAAPGVPSAAGPLTAPFTWSWNNIMGGVQGSVGNMITTVENLVWPVMAAIVAVLGIYWGMEWWFRDMKLGEVAWRVIVLGLVLGSIYPGNDTYTTYVVGAVEQLPTYFAQQINACAGAGGAASQCPNPAAGPAAVFDSVWQAFYIKMLHIWHATPFFDKVLLGLILVFVIGDVAFALGSMYFVFLATNFILYVMLVVGPVFILLSVFPATNGFFRFWRDAIVSGLLFILTLDVLLGFFTTVLNQLITAVNVGETTTWTDMVPSVLGAVIVFNVMAFAVALLTFQIGRIQGASSRMIGATAATAAGWVAKAAL